MIAQKNHKFLNRKTGLILIKVVQNNQCHHQQRGHGRKRSKLRRQKKNKRWRNRRTGRVMTV
jgi:hypothetical protein